MDTESMRQATREAVKKKFGRKRYVTSKVMPHYPENLEREYVRVMNAYMKMFKSALAERLPDIRNVLEQGGLRTDAANNESYIEESDVERFLATPTAAAVAAMKTEIDAIFAEIAKDIAERQGAGSLSETIRGLDRLIKQSGKFTISQWKRVVKKTLGIDIMDDYYNGSKFRQIFDKWVAENVGLIRTIPREALGRMRTVVNDGYLRGATTKEIAREIQQSYDKGKSHAQFIARDQMAKLNSDITREQQQDAGVSEYVWRTVNDSRVRTRHRQLNGEKRKYTDPPIVDERTGRCANPGRDYQCRCVALPVFDIDTVVLPWQSGEDLNFTYATDLKK